MNKIVFIALMVISSLALSHGHGKSETEKLNDGILLNRKFTIEVFPAPDGADITTVLPSIYKIFNNCSLIFSNSSFI